MSDSRLVRFHPLYLFLHFILLVLKWSPLALAEGFARFLSKIIPLFAKKERRLIQRNLHRAMGLAPHSAFSKIFATQVLRHQIFSTVETLKEIVSPGSIKVVGFDQYKGLVDKARRHNRGVIVFTGHIGSWELVARYGAMATGQTFNALAKPSKYRFFTQFLEDLRPKMQTKILWSHKPSLMKDMLKALKANEILGFVMDQRPENQAGHEVDFLGLKTVFVSGPARVAFKYRSPAIGVFCVREGPWRYKIIAECLPEDWAQERGEVALTGLMAETIGRTIKLYPEQWLWNYRRWPSYS